MQPGPIYFKTLRKCAIFGIMCEAIPQQVNYLIDEASDVGNGANTTIRYVHHFFEHYGLGETSVHLHADDCSGQNKNNYFVWYLAWRTILQLHLSVRYSFLIAGHTKFAPDRCFGIIKKLYKQNYISSIYEFANMVESSSTGVNKHSLVKHMTEQLLFQCMTGVHILNSTFKGCQTLKATTTFDSPKMSLVEFTSQRVTCLPNSC